MIFYQINQKGVLLKPYLTTFMARIFAWMAILALAGCGSQPATEVTSTLIETEVDRSSLSFSELAAQSSGATAERYRLLALKQSLLDQDYILAAQFFEQLDFALLSNQEANSALLSAITLENHNSPAQDFENALQGKVPSRADLPEWNYYMGMAQAYLGDKRVASELYFSCTNLPEAQISYR